MSAMRHLIAIALAACSSAAPSPVKPAPVATVDAGPPPDAAALDHDLPRLAERGVKLYEEVAQAFRGAGEDCGAATTKLGELARVYGDVTAANRTVLHEGRARELKVALAPHEDRLDAAAKDIMQSSTMARCAQDPAFSKSFDDLVGAPP
jgi:hypothetical protein